MKAVEILNMTEEHSKQSKARLLFLNWLKVLKAVELMEILFSDFLFRRYLL